MNCPADVVLTVHLYGRKAPTDFGERIHVVEDLAEAHGIAPNPNSDAACWSFYKNKVIAGEEGAVYLEFSTPALDEADVFTDKRVIR